MLRRKLAAVCVAFIMFFSLGTTTVLARPINSKFQESLTHWVEKQWAGHKIQNVRIDSIQTKGDIQFVVVSYVKDGKAVFSMEVGLKQKGVFEAVYGATSNPHVQGQKLFPIDQMAVGGTMGASHKHYFMQGGYVNDRNITVVRIKFNDGTVKQLRVPPDHIFAYGTLTATGVMQLTGYDRHGHMVWTMN